MSANKVKLKRMAIAFQPSSGSNSSSSESASPLAAAIYWLSVNKFSEEMKSSEGGFL